jgi:hypothetical protein
MKIKFNKIAAIIALGFALCFAQEEATPERLAVYASGANDAGINKSMSNKLLAAMVQSGLYMEIGDPASFQNELAKSGKSDLAYITQAAKRYGSDYVCVVNITEVFGTHSLVARLIKIDGSHIVKTGSTDRSLKSLEDLTVVSNELASQLISSVAAPPPHHVEEVALPPPPVAPVLPVLPAPPMMQAHQVALETPQQDTTPTHQPAPPPPPPPPPPLPPSLADVLAPTTTPAPLATQKQCAKTYNVNELLLKIKENFPKKLSDCSGTLAKDMLNPFGKKLEPKSFMIQCPIEGIKKELPEGFPNVDKILANLTNFTQNLINSASSGGALDPKKLISAVAGMNVGELLNEVKKLSTDECVVDVPYALPTAPMSLATPTNSESEENSNSTVSFGIRAGFNLSHTYAEYHNIVGFGNGSGNYGDIFGIQLGFILDIALSDWFYIQPGFMYIQKGREEKDDFTAHYLEFPFLLSLKSNLIPIRINAGPYMGLCLSSKADIFDKGFDFGLNMGLGYDIDMFYIGVFYDYGFANMSDKKGYDFYNRTLGINFGVNL